MHTDWEFSLVNAYTCIQDQSTTQNIFVNWWWKYDILYAACWIEMHNFIICDPVYRMICFCSARPQMEIQLQIPVEVIFCNCEIFLQDNNCLCVLNVLWKFQIKMWCLNGVILMISGPVGNWPNNKPQALKTDFSISYFSIPQRSNKHNFVEDYPISKSTMHHNGRMCTLIIYQELNFDHVHRRISFWQHGSHYIFIVKFSGNFSMCMYLIVLCNLLWYVG